MPDTTVLISIPDQLQNSREMIHLYIGMLTNHAVRHLVSVDKYELATCLERYNLISPSWCSKTVVQDLNTTSTYHSILSAAGYDSHNSTAPRTSWTL